MTNRPSSGDKSKRTREEAERDREDARRASSAYETPESEQMGSERDLSGLPWGSLSMKHVVKSGKEKEKDTHQSSQSGSAAGESYRSKQ